MQNIFSLQWDQFLSKIFCCRCVLCYHFACKCVDEKPMDFLDGVVPKEGKKLCFDVKDDGEQLRFSLESYGQTFRAVHWPSHKTCSSRAKFSQGVLFQQPFPSYSVLRKRNPASSVEILTFVGENLACACPWMNWQAHIRNQVTVRNPMSVNDQFGASERNLFLFRENMTLVNSVRRCLYFQRSGTRIFHGDRGRAPVRGKPRGPSRWD